MTAPEQDADDSDRAEESAARLRALRPVDCDIHPPTPVMAELLPYLDDHWREVMVSRGIDGLGLASYPPGAAISARPEWHGPVSTWLPGRCPRRNAASSSPARAPVTMSSVSSASRRSLAGAAAAS